MTLYGIGLGPGGSDLLTIRGRRRLESVDVVYSPGRLSRRVAAEYVPDRLILFMDEEAPLVTSDPEDVAGRDYYTPAYAEKRSISNSE